MKLSIFTPTHNTKYLKELEDTILKQTHTDWEWIILLNNGAQYQSKDKRIKIITSKSNTTKVGALKKEACSYATGEILVEVDHDDLLIENCLEELNKVFEKERTVGFAYSDNIKFSDTFKPYSQRYGWTYRKVMYNDRELIAMNTFEPDPFRLSYIWYAPDHVRAWRKSVYDEIGGHNEELSICDDHELMIRTYLKTEFKRIPKPLYIYRILEDGSNTWIQRNKEIQRITKQLHKQYKYDLVNRYRELIGMTKNINNPKVSIITPTYNATPEKLLKCIQYIQAQTYKDYEHVIVADGPHPELKKFVETLDDHRIYFVELKENSGNCGHTARNTGLTASQGEFVYFFDDDNALFIDAIENMVLALENTPDEVGFVIADIVHNGPLPRGLRAPMIMKGEPVRVGNIDTMNCMLKKNKLVETGGWVTKEKYCGDGLTFEQINRFYKYKKINKIVGVHL